VDVGFWHPMKENFRVKVIAVCTKWAAVPRHRVTTFSS
jgi:hypothetical protein